MSKGVGDKEEGDKEEGDKEEGEKGGKLGREGGDDNYADAASTNFWLAGL